MTRRFYVAPGSIERSGAPGGGSPFSFTAYVTGGEALHAVQVLRLKAGDPVLVFDGSGYEYSGTVRRIAGRREAPVVEVSGGEARLGAAEPPFEVVLVQGLPKADKLEEIVEKGTEVGVTRFLPVRTERSLAQYSPEKAEAKRLRLERIALSAAKQSGRSRVPQVLPFCDLAPGELNARLAGLVWIAFWERAAAPLRRVMEGLLKDGEPGKGVALFIGPEGGFSEREAGMLEACGARLCSLGPRILRTETAGPVAAALVLYAAGEGDRRE
mgnify:CR=1 FL=1